MRAGGLLLAAATSVAAALGGPAAGAERPRIVSLDYCADQYVLALADPDQILGVSTGPNDSWSALRDRARGAPRVRDAAEDVVALEPDLIVRAYGGGPRALAFYDRLGLPVHDIGYPADFDQIRAAIRRTAAAIGQVERGEALIVEMDARLTQAGAPRSGPAPQALYVTPGGVTSGSGTLIHQVLEAARVNNLAARSGASGWLDLPLETLILAPPELVVTGFFNMPDEQIDPWSATRHPVLRRRLGAVEAVHLDGAHLACATWLLADAALAVRHASDRRTERDAP